MPRLSVFDVKFCAMWDAKNEIGKSSDKAWSGCLRFAAHSFLKDTILQHRWDTALPEIGCTCFVLIIVFLQSGEFEICPCYLELKCISFLLLLWLNLSFALFTDISMVFIYCSIELIDFSVYFTDFCMLFIDLSIVFIDCSMVFIDLSIGFIDLSLVFPTSSGMIYEQWIDVVNKNYNEDE